MKVLVTGGTVFVSKYLATWLSQSGYDVYVLNRGNRKQPLGTTHIHGDRHHLGQCLKGLHFDAVIDTAYTEGDVADLLDGLGGFDDYIFISSSAVYPETLPQPFVEEQPIGKNVIWGDYGLGKVNAEHYLRRHVPQAYILRPPYLYGPMQNVYREAFVFDCALSGRPFYVPKDGKMPLQFFHVEDLCRLIALILRDHPQQHVLNVGNTAVVDINQFVQICYDIAGAALTIVNVYNQPNQRNFFCFHDYSYVLDVKKQDGLLPQKKDLAQGLRESYEWYRSHPNDVIKKDYLQFIDQNIPHPL